MTETLDDFYKNNSNCARCSLSSGATNVVFGFGSPDSKIVFVGEAPGYHEDKEGKPFVGAAGKLLTKLLSDIGIDRDDVYITNVLKCRPPGNRDPRPEEIEACKPLLVTQLQIIKPRIIATLGSFAARTILKRTQPMSKIHGHTARIDDYLVFPTYHPAAALYTRATLKLLEEDFQNIRQLLERSPDEDRADVSHQQLGLF